MALILEALIQIILKPSLLEIAIEMLLFAAPLWIALIAGLIIGWAWRPRLVVEGGEKVRVVMAASQLSLSSCISTFISADKRRPASAAVEMKSDAAPVEIGKVSVGTEDLDYLCWIMEERDGDKPCIHMMDRLLPGMAYQA